jgi:hypothetical protein
MPWRRGLRREWLLWVPGVGRWNPCRRWWFPRHRTFKASSINTERTQPRRRRIAMR